MINDFYIQLQISLVVKFYDIWGAAMAVNYKAPGALLQTSFRGFTAFPMTLWDFYFVETINVPFGLCPSKV